MTSIQRIDLKANAVQFRNVARYLADAAMRRAEAGDTGLAAACAHESERLFAKARKFEQKAKQPFVWAAAMPPFILRDFSDYTLGFLRENPAAYLLLVAGVLSVVLVKIATYYGDKKDREQMRKSMRIASMADARKELRERMRDGNEAA